MNSQHRRSIRAIRFKRPEAFEEAGGSGADEAGAAGLATRRKRRCNMSSSSGDDELISPSIDAIESRPPTENTAKKQRGRPFKAGWSGNPEGRPRGSRNKATMAVEALLDGEANAIARKAVEKALEGDMAALRLCLERVLPPRRDRPVVFDLPKIEGVSDALNASSAVLTA